MTRALAAGLPAAGIAVAMIILQGGVPASFSLLDVSQRILPLALAAGFAALWALRAPRLARLAFGAAVALALIPPYARNFWGGAQAVLAGVLVVAGCYGMAAAGAPTNKPGAAREHPRRLSPEALVLAFAAASYLVFDSGSFVFAAQLAAVGAALLAVYLAPRLRPLLVTAAAPLFAALLVAAWLYGGLSHERLVVLAALPWVATFALRHS